MASLYGKDFADDAVLTYIPTATSISGSRAIGKHFESREIRIKAQKILGRIETPSSLVLDVENVIELLSSGGAYLPGLDNFVTDKIITFPSIHLVHLNGIGNVHRVRIHWDQASLLKQVGVIGSRSNSWPITDTREQTRLITSSINSVNKISEGALPSRGRPAPQASDNGVTVKPSRSESPSKQPLKDPHASLDLFAPIESGPNTPVQEKGPSVLSPQPSAKPPPRDLGELFVSEGPKPYASSPPKGAAGRFHPSRLWDPEGDVDEQPKVKIGNAPKLTARPKATHNSHWDFDDFNTPEKPRQKVRGQDQRHFGLGEDDEPGDAVKPSRVLKPRGQQVRHFGWGEDESFPDQEVESKGPHHQFRKDQKTQFDIKDNSPTAQTAANRGPGKVRKDQESHFDFYNASPARASATNGKENKPIKPPHRGGGYTVNRLFDFDDE